MFAAFADNSLGLSLPIGGALTAAQRVVVAQVERFLDTPSRVAKMEATLANIAESDRRLSAQENEMLERFAQQIEVLKERYNRTLDKIQNAVNVAAGLGIIDTPRLPARLRVNRSRLPADMQGFGAAPAVAGIAALVAAGLISVGIIAAIRETAASEAEAQGVSDWWQVQNERARQGLAPTARPTPGSSSIERSISALGKTALVVAALAGLGFAAWRLAK